MLKVRNAWYLRCVSNYGAVETLDGKIFVFKDAAFRDVSPDLIPIEDVFPGYPALSDAVADQIPRYVLRFYGLERS